MIAGRSPAPDSCGAWVRTTALTGTRRGLVAFVAWLGVHRYYLTGVRNRTTTVIAWMRSFVGTARPGFAEVATAPRREPERIAGSVAGGRPRRAGVTIASG